MEEGKGVLASTNVEVAEEGKEGNGRRGGLPTNPFIPVLFLPFW